MILLKRVYEHTSKKDGTRILVDRLWPRGISKEKEELLGQIKKQKSTVTLVFAAKNIEHNNAVALREYLEK